MWFRCHRSLRTNLRGVRRESASLAPMGALCRRAEWGKSRRHADTPLSFSGVSQAGGWEPTKRGASCCFERADQNQHRGAFVHTVA